MANERVDCTLQRERRVLQQASRLRWFHWVILGLSLTITLIAWQASSRTADERAEQRFDRQADQVIALFEERLRSYSDLLQGAVGLVLSTDELTAERWHRYISALRLDQRYPAITGIGVMERVTRAQLPAYLARQRERRPEFGPSPEHERPIHLLIAQVAPRRIEDRALGLDLAHESRRYEAAQEALRSGMTTITAPVRPTPRDAKGFLMFAPFYREPLIETAAPGEGPPFAGALAVSILVRDVAAGILDKERRLLWVGLSDDGETIYDERDPAHPLSDPEPMFSRSVDISMFGRTWHFGIDSNLAFREDAISYTSALVLGGGLFIDSMLYGLFVLLTRSNRRALSFARRAGEDLRAESESLAAANRELETFAYAVSHDLKTPLNGIGHLAGFIEEDLADCPEVEEISPDVPRNVHRIRRQVERAHTLIEGILDYSGLGAAEERPTLVDTRVLLTAIGETLGVGAERLTLLGDFPELLTYETRLSQVLTNLVGNAFKYHHDTASARVIVEAEEVGDFQRFSVTDDGPGIDPADHERIFELFQTLGKRDDVDSTGVGLAIVKKAVEHVGGTVTVASAPGCGTRFTFDWPTRIEPNDDREAGPEEYRSAA